MNEVYNLGKIPYKLRMKYRVRLVKYNNSNKDEVLFEELRSVVKEIEQQMNLHERIKNFIPSNWKYFIDDDYNFWILTNDYLKRNFKNEENDK